MSETSFLESNRDIQQLRMVFRTINSMSFLELPYSIQESLRETMTEIKRVVDSRWRAYIDDLVTVISCKPYIQANISDILSRESGSKIDIIRYLRSELSISITDAKAAAEVYLDSSTVLSYSL